MKTTELILKSEIANSNDNNVEKAKRNYADFLKMGEYCETIACRHKLFSNYFGDVPLPCKNRCDVCKNPKEAQDALDNFLQLSYNFFLEPVQYEDESDLNGGKCNYVPFVIVSWILFCELDVQTIALYYTLSKVLRKSNLHSIDSNSLRKSVFGVNDNHRGLSRTSNKFKEQWLARKTSSFCNNFLQAFPLKPSTLQDLSHASVTLLNATSI